MFSNAFFGVMAKSFEEPCKREMEYTGKDENNGEKDDEPIQVEQIGG